MKQESALNEVRLLASLQNDFTVSFKEAFLDDSYLCIIMEYCPNGDLSQKINGLKKDMHYISENEVWNCFLNLLYGLKSLHDSNIMHRDLKCANVFISDSNYKLGDLNVSKIADRGLAFTQTGTPYFAAPEVWKEKPYNNKCDIWSLGCVIYEMCALEPPF